MTLLVTLASLSSPSWASDSEVLGWDWSRTHRFALESQVQLPLLMWFATPFNHQARVTAFDLRIVTTCGNAQVETRRVVEVLCTIDDIALSAAGMPQEEGLLQPILTELDDLLTGSAVQMRMNHEGRIVNIDLEGLDRRNQRVGRISENMRLVVSRAFSGLDMQLPRGDELQWAQYDNWLMRAPSAEGSSGAAGTGLPHHPVGRARHDRAWRGREQVRHAHDQHDRLRLAHRPHVRSGLVRGGCAHGVLLDRVRGGGLSLHPAGTRHRPDRERDVERGRERGARAGLGPLGDPAEHEAGSILPPLKLDWTEILVCPRCRGDLVDDPRGLLCCACALLYPIVDGIPWMDEALAHPAGDPP
jgi:uncharacterized protein YbaR (Trm112 family)